MIQEVPIEPKFRPTFIIPSSDILQSSKQEVYADQVEFALFDMVTEEGGLGGMSNDLYKSNAVNDSIRYQKAGVTLQNSVLYNQNLHNPSTQEVKGMFLGLPPIQFVNERKADATYFEDWDRYQAKHYYVNGENTAIEFLSPYRDFSNTEVYWNTFPKNVLYSEVP